MSTRNSRAIKNGLTALRAALRAARFAVFLIALVVGGAGRAAALGSLDAGGGASSSRSASARGGAVEPARVGGKTTTDADADTQTTSPDADARITENPVDDGYGVVAAAAAVPAAAAAPPPPRSTASSTLTASPAAPASPAPAAKPAPTPLPDGDPAPAPTPTPAPKPAAASSAAAGKPWDRWLFLGGWAGGGVYDGEITHTVTTYTNGYVTDRNSYTESESVTLMGAGFQTQLQLAHYFAVELDLAVGFDKYSVYPVLPLLAKLTFWPGIFTLDLGVGYTIGSGFSGEAGLGCRIGNGVLFGNFMLIANDKLDSPIALGIFGYRAGLLAKRRG